jgi:hypothetical protein
MSLDCRQFYMGKKSAVTVTALLRFDFYAMSSLKPRTHELSGAMGRFVPHRSRQFMGSTGFLVSGTSRDFWHQSWRQE